MKKYKTPFEELALNSIQADDLDITENATDFDKIRAVFKRQAEEYGYENKRHGLEKGFTSWLQGLPSVLHFPFYYHDILNWAKAVNYELDTEEKKDKFLEDYFSNLGNAFITLYNNL